MNMTCPEDFQFGGFSNPAIHNIQALQAGNYLLQSYSNSSPYSGPLLLPGFHTSPALTAGGAGAAASPHLLNGAGGSLSAAAVVSAAAAAANTQQLPPQLPSYHAATATPPTSSPSISSGKSVVLAAGLGGLPPGQNQPDAKKFRSPMKTVSKTPKYIPKPIPQELGNLKTYSNPDILICGNCRELYNDIVDMLDHKKHYCKMRFTCKCESGAEHLTEAQCKQSNSANTGCEKGKGEGTRVQLKCSQCKETFPGAWDLLFHVQNAHSLNIYSLGQNRQMKEAKSS